MSTIEKSIDVEVPIGTAYNQWTQFESFPQFMDGVEEVRQVDDRRLHWKGRIAGVTREWDAEIVDQTPDERITWRAVDGTTNVGSVSFSAIQGTTTRVTLHMEVEPEGIVERAGDGLHLIERQVTSDLDHFKQFIESRGTATGAWRGEIDPAG